MVKIYRPPQVSSPTDRVIRKGFHLLETAVKKNVKFALYSWVHFFRGEYIDLKKKQSGSTRFE